MINALRSELTKALTLRSIRFTLLAALVVQPLLAFFSGLALDPLGPPAAGIPLESQGFETAGFGQPIIILLAALVAGSEYLDGQWATTLSATPQRGRVFTAKLTVIAMLSASAAVVATTAAVFLKHAVLGQRGLGIDQFTPGMALNILGVMINYALLGLISANLTMIMRNHLAAVVVMVPLVLGLTISLVGAIPVLRFLPDLAGIQLLMAYPGIGLLDPVWGAIVMSGWAFMLGGTAWLLLRMRDVGSA